MINRSLAKYIKSLQNKKIRKESKQFIVEGYKSIEELLKSDYQIDKICIFIV
jgi:TrmH family RNA methyltransferase